MAFGSCAPQNTNKAIKKQSDETNLKYTEYLDKDGNVIARDYNANDIKKYIAEKEGLTNSTNNSTDNARTIRITYDTKSETINQDGFKYQTNQASAKIYQLDWWDNKIFLKQENYLEKIQYPTQNDIIVSNENVIETNCKAQTNQNKIAIGLEDSDSTNISLNQNIVTSGNIANNSSSTSADIISQRKLELSKMNIDEENFEYFYDLSEEEYKRAVLLIENNIMDSKNASQFAKLSEEKLSTALGIIDEEGEISDDLLKLGELNREQYEYFLQLLNKGEDISNLKELLKLDKEGFEKFRTLYDSGMKDFLSLNIVQKCTNEQYQRCIDLIKSGSDCYEAWSTAKLSESKYERYKKAISIGEYSFGALEIAQYDDFRYAKYQELLSSGMDTFTARNISKLNDEQISMYRDLISSGLSEKDSYQIVGFDEKKSKQYKEYINNGLSPITAKEFVEYTGNAKNHLIELSKRGVGTSDAKAIVMYNDNEIYNRTVDLLENGVEMKDAITTGRNPEDYKALMEEINSTPNAMRDFLNSDSYDEKIKNATTGKYQQELLSMLDNSKMNFSTKKSLLESNLDEKDFLNSIKKLSSSTFKLAMNTPNQYLSNIDTKYTTKIDGKYPTLQDKELNKQQDQIKEFFSLHIGQILRALKYLDTDTLNQMMDKRTSKFADDLVELDSLSNENYELLSKLIKGCKTQYTEEEKTAYIEKRNKNKKPLNETQLKALKEQTTRDLTAKEKIQLCQIVEIYQKTGIDTSNLIEMSEKGEVDFESAKQKIQDEVLKSVGISEQELSKIPKDKTKLNEEYSYLALKNKKNTLTEEEATKENIQQKVDSLRTMNQDELQEEISKLESQMDSEDFILKAKNNPQLREISENILEIYENINNYSNEEICEALLKKAMLISNTSIASDDLSIVVRESILGNFEDFIQDESNVYGKTNAKTKNAFIENNLDYEQWLKPDIPDVNFELNGQKMTIKMWDRNPQEDLFMGNKTSCCTAIGTGANADATPTYLLNTSYNVVELYDEEGEVVGMSRIFMANVDEKPAIIMDNIELNSNYKDTKTSQDTKTKIRNNFFKYMNNLAKQVTNSSDTNVYFCFEDALVPTSDLEYEDITLDFIGSLSQEKIYINSIGNSWLDPTKLFKEEGMEFFIVPKNE